MRRGNVSGGEMSGPKCPVPLFSTVDSPTLASGKSVITSQLLTKMADMETKIHVALV